MSELNGELLSSALRYAEMGYPVFPCVPGGKRPLTEHGFKDATTDPEAIEMWWREYPQANIGIPTEGMLVVDVDGADNGWPEDVGHAEELASSPMSRTPGGGRHHIYKQPAGKGWRNTASQLSTKVDTRADGGYIVVPPSRVNGGAYEWVSELDTEPEGLQQPPDWLITALDNVGDNGCAEMSENGDGNSIPSGQRNATLTRLAGNMRRVGMTKDEIHVALLQTNHDRCKPPMAEHEVKQITDSISNYPPDQIAVAVAENHWAQIVCPDTDTEDTVQTISDPGPIPDELLRVPGFVSEVMDYTLKIAPYPNEVMSFAGALSMQAFLAGRKVRDQGDCRTNIYLLGLAQSAAGKDHPRKINMRIAHEVGLENCFGDRFASGEGIQDVLFVNPCMLFQSDEFNEILLSINKAKDNRYESIMGTLLNLYSASNSVFPMRHKAGNTSSGSIDQPCMVVFGTAIPKHYYEALSERMLTNGLFARMIVLESRKRSRGQRPSISPLPDRVIETARWWTEFTPGRGNLEDWHPIPAIVEQSQGAIRVSDNTREEADNEYAAAEERGDNVGMTVWGRAWEHSQKLALLHAISANHKEPIIDEAAAVWAARFAMHQVRRMLHMAQCHVADNPFHAECLKLKQKLREAPGQTLSHSLMLKKMRIDTRNLQKLVSTLKQQDDIEVIETKTAGRTASAYRLIGD